MSKQDIIARMVQKQKAIDGAAGMAKQQEKTEARQALKNAIVTAAFPGTQIKNAVAKVEADKAAGVKIPLAQTAFPASVKADLAKKEYDDYMGTKKQDAKPAGGLLAEYERDKAQSSQKSPVKPGDYIAGTAAEKPDEREAGLKAQADFYENQANIEKNAEITAKDMAEYETWSEEDKKNLDDYITYSRSPQTDQNALYMAQSNPLVEKYGLDKVKQMAESREWQRTQELAAEVQQNTKARVENNPVASGILENAASVGASLIGSLTTPASYMADARVSTGRYTTMNPNTAGGIFNTYSGAVREQTAKNIQGDGQSFLRNLAAVGYQGGMSALDSAARLAAAGGNPGISAAIAASGSFSNSMSKYSAQGVDPGQAAGMAFVDAGLEYMTEKLTDSQMLDFYKGGGKPEMVKRFLWQTFGVEPLSEEVNLFAGIAAEAAILGDKSSQNQQIGEMVSYGMSYEQANKEYWKQITKEAAQTYLVSVAAAGIGRAGAAIVGNQVRSPQEQQGILQTPAAEDNTKLQLAVEDVAAALQQKTPAATPEAPVTDVQQQLRDAMDTVTAPEGQMTANEDAGQSIDMDARMEEIQRMDAQRAADKQRQKQVYEELQAAKRRQKELQKQIDKAEQKLKDTGKGSRARIDQLKVELEQQDNLVAQIESQHTYFTGDYERTLGEAVQRQTGIFEDARNAARQAIADHEAGEISDAQLKAANDAYNTAGQELYRLKHLSQEQYVDELSEVGLIGDHGPLTEKAPQAAPSPESRRRVAEAIAKSWEDMNGGEKLRTLTAEELSQKPDMAVINIGRNTEGKNYTQLKSDISQKAEQEHWYDAPYFNKDTGMPVFLTRKTLTHSYSNLTEDHGTDTLLALQHLPEIAESAVLVDVSPPRNPKKPETRVLTFFAAAETENGTVPVKLTVKEYDSKSGNPMPQPIRQFFETAKLNGNFDSLYDLEALEIMEPKSAKKELGASAIVATGSEEPNANSTPNSSIRVPDLLDLVKGDAEKYIPGHKNTGIDSVNTSVGRQQTEDSGTVSDDGVQSAEAVSTGPDYRASNTYMNTGIHSENPNIQKGYRQELRKDPGAALYEVKHNADTLAEAQSRTGSAEKNAAALEDLLSKEHWTPEDVATSTLLQDQIMASGDQNTIDRMDELRKKKKEAGTYFGQGAQAFAINNPTMKGAESPATAVDTFRSRLYGMKPEETTWSPKSGQNFEAWKEQIGREVDKIGIAIATVEDGDADSMRQIIRQIAQRRNTTAWFGTSDNLTGRAWGILKKLDFDDLKKIANTQLVAMADDYRARSTGEIVGGLRKQSMLSSLKTFNRNIAGNTVGGFADAVSESCAGRMMDAVLSGFTGKRTVGNDFARTGTYVKAAKEAGQFASLCVELNIPIETDVESSYEAAAGKGGNSKYMGRTFRATGNPAMRALYAYQKYMSYALEVTDKIFEGGSNAAVAESLNRLKDANLSQEEIGRLADFTSNKRTFKNATWEEDGEKKGSELAQLASRVKNFGGTTTTGKIVRGATEIAMPFTNVPMNVTQTGIDYTAGVAKGLGEVIGIIKDAKAGKDIPVERQRQAASDFGRGVTGTAMIVLFAAAAAKGILKDSSSGNWDKEALAQAEGRSGVQINWSALQRSMEGGDATWKAGDVISGMDFLEPFNTQMYLGAELAQADDIDLLTYAGSTVKSVWQSLMDSPVMTGLADIEQTLNDVLEAEAPTDIVNVAAGYAGDVASSFVPQFVRQTAQNMDGYYRDTRAADPLQSAINTFMAAIPGQSQKLPKKYSGLGQVQQRGSAVETFLDPTATKQYQANEVTAFLDELSARTGDDGIYPSRQAPMRFTVAGREVELDGEMRETYQRTYGQQVDALYRSLKDSKDFQSLSDEMQTAALKAAENNAVMTARAAVSDFRGAPTGSPEEQAREIINQQVRKQMGGIFTELDTNREYGYSTEDTAAKLEESYKAFTELDQKTQAEILADAASDTAKFLEVRQKGVTAEQYVGVTQRIDGLKLQPGYKEIRPAQQWQTIADMPGLSDKAKDILMKAYMEDYEPNVKGSDTVELKYDYARQELDMSASEFALAYDIYSHEKHVGGTGTADRTRERMVKELGITEGDAKQLYKLYGGQWKPWE